MGLFQATTFLLVRLVRNKVSPDVPSQPSGYVHQHEPESQPLPPLGRWKRNLDLAALKSVRGF